eukprot:4746553-Lingulodinium_polyedra.AAC.1
MERRMLREEMEHMKRHRARRGIFLEPTHGKTRRPAGPGRAYAETGWLGGNPRATRNCEPVHRGEKLRLERQTSAAAN